MIALMTTLGGVKYVYAQKGTLGSLFYCPGKQGLA